MRTWAMRGTLHLLAAEDLQWLLPLVVRHVIPTADRGLQRLGVADAPKAMRVIERALEREGPLTRGELADRLARRGFETTGQIGIHLFRRACLQGVACMGPDRDRKATFILTRDWIPQGKPMEPEAAWAELGRRYLIAFGPAEPADLASWAGLPLAMARRSFGLLGGELEPLEADGCSLWSLRSARQEEIEPVAIRLLPSYDTYLLGYRGRELVVPAAHAREVHPGGGIIHPTVIRAGKVVGTWRAERRGRKIGIRVRPFARLRATETTAVQEEIDDIGRFLGLEAAMIRP